ncbi:MAG TPA: ATP-binding protein [Stellaceae bacterium]|nr:ATP-binding protein [Stellaceae bacterium]
MTLRQEAASPPAPPLGRRERLAAAGLALCAVIAPLAVAALAGPLPLRYAGTLALALSLLGPGLATILVGWRGLGVIAQELSLRPDGEPQQALIRIFVSAAALAYIGGLAAAGVPLDRLQPVLAIDVLGALASWLILLAVMLGPAAAARRRAAALAGDVALISVFLHYGGAAGAPWVSAYLWVSLGYGWRYGAPALLVAALLGAIGFGGVVLATPFWRDMPGVSCGILVALIVPALSAAAFAQRLGAVGAEAEATRTARSRLLAVMSHELRTPLNALIGMGSLLARTRLDSEQRDMLGTMQLSARTLLGLINDLLDLSKLEAGKLAPKTESFVLREVLGGAVAILRPQAEAKGLELALTIDPRLPHVCRGLPLQFRQVLMNLLANAIKFTPRGHVGVAATLAGRGAGVVRLRLAVRDEGIGVPAAARERIFHIFAQGDDTVPDRYGGTGLGLAIAKQLIDLMGGTITLESELGAGSTFTVELPLACEEDATLRPPDLIGRRVVVVTPDRELAATLQAWLRAWRAETQWYVTGDDALAVLGGERGAARHILLIDGRSDPVAGLSLAHRFASGAAQRPSVVFIAPAQASEAVAGLAATQLAAAIEEPVTETALASAFLSVLAMAAEEVFAPPPEAAEPRRLHILVAEDDAASREILKNLLGRAGHQIEFATEGGAALAALDKGGVDLALLDLNMPGVSGDAVAKLHRLRHPGDFVPLIALTADATEETELMCREAGFDTVLTKPVEAARLLAAIDETCAGRAAAPPPETTQVVTPITDHPRFGSEAIEVIDSARIESLRGLGGNEFVAEVVETFEADASRILARLKQAIERGDIGEFGELAHSLRSGAANLGGTRLCQTLTAIEDVTAKDLRQAGFAYFEKIETEVGRLELALDQLSRSHRHA